MEIEALGMIAGLLTTFAFVPQAWAIWKAKKADGISIPMYCILLVGIGLWFFYGLKLGSFPIMLYNGLTFALVSLILAMKVKFG